MVSSFFTLEPFRRSASRWPKKRRRKSWTLRICTAPSTNSLLFETIRTAWREKLPGQPVSPAVEDVALSNEADTAAYGGQLRKARDLSRQAAASAERAGEKEPVAEYHAQSGLREALFGNSAKGQEGASAALTLSNGREVQFIAAMALRDRRRHKQGSRARERPQQTLPGRHRRAVELPSFDRRSDRTQSSRRVEGD